MAQKSRKHQIKGKKTVEFIVYIVLGLTVVVAPSIYSNKVLDNTLMPRFVGIAVFILLFLVYYLANYKKTFSNYDFSIFKKPVFLIYLLFLILTLVSISYSINKSEASFDFLKIFTFFQLFVLFSLFLTKHKDTRKEITQMFVIFSLIITLTGVLSYLELLNDPAVKNLRRAVYQIRGNFAHKNLFSQSLLVSLGFTIYGVVSLKKYWKIASAITSFLSVVLIVLFLSRAIWLSSFVAISVTSLFYILFINKDKKLSEKLIMLAKVVGIIVVISVITAVIYTSSNKKNSITKHIIAVTNTKSGSTFHRLDLWKKSSGIIEDHFVVGVGAANWKTVVLKYGIGEQGNGGWKYPVRPHNDYLWILSELGIVGFLTFLAILGSMFYYLYLFLKKSEDEDQKIFTLALIFGLTAYLSFSFFSFPKERIESQIFLHLIFAYIVSNYHNLQKKETKSKVPSKILISGLGIVSLVIISVAIFAGMQRVNTEMDLQKIIGNQKAKKFDKVIPLVDNAIRPFATLDHAGLPILYYKGVALLQIKKMEEGKKVLLEALEVHPYHSTIITALGYAESLEGNNDEAKKYFKQVLEIHPNDRMVLKNLAIIYKKDEQNDSAYFALNKIEPKFKDKGYNQLMKIQLQIKVKALTDSLDTRQITKLIGAKFKDTQWLFNLYKKNWEIGLNFETLFLETIIIEAKENNYNKKSINQLETKLGQIKN